MKNFFLACRESRIEPSSPPLYYGSFYIGPFENGHALTIANALRRTLLSEIPGLGITALKMGGVFHEYSNLIGMRENVMDVLLNFKEIVLKKTTPVTSILPNFQKKNQKLPSLLSRTPIGHRTPSLKQGLDSMDAKSWYLGGIENKDSSKQIQVGYLQVRGPGTIRASDLQLPPTLECVDPDQYICTLNEQGSLNVVFTIEEGKNFLFRKNKIDFSNLAKIPTFAHMSTNSKRILRTEGEFLPIDPVFSPIKRVNYSIQGYSSETVYKSNQFVILEIWTNGSISPKEALSQTLNFLRFVFSELGKLEVLNSISNSFSISENSMMRQAFRDIDRDLDFFEYSMYKKNFLLTDSTYQTLKGFHSNLSLSLSLKESRFVETNRTLFSEETYITEFGLPFSIFKALYKEKILKVADLLKFTKIELEKILNLDKSTFEFLIQKLKEKNFNLS